MTSRLAHGSTRRAAGPQSPRGEGAVSAVCAAGAPHGDARRQLRARRGDERDSGLCCPATTVMEHVA